jgi:hypothetical protein
MSDELKERNILKLILIVRFACATLDVGHPLTDERARKLIWPVDSQGVRNDRNLMCAKRKKSQGAKSHEYDGCTASRMGLSMQKLDIFELYGT